MQLQRLSAKHIDNILFQDFKKETSEFERGMTEYYVFQIHKDNIDCYFWIGMTFQNAIKIDIVYNDSMGAMNFQVTNNTSNKIILDKFHEFMNAFHRDPETAFDMFQLMSASSIPENPEGFKKFFDEVKAERSKQNQE